MTETILPRTIEDHVDSRSFRWTIIDATMIVNPRITIVQPNGSMVVDRGEMALASSLEIARKRILTEHSVISQPRWAIILKCYQPEDDSELWSFVLVRGSLGLQDRLDLQGLATLPVLPKIG